MKNLPFCLMLFVCFNLSAQQWINCTNGLTVNDGMLQDDILWLATTGGLARIDINTSETTIYNRGNSPIPSNEIHSILIDHNGQIWVSTYQETAVFNGVSWQVFYDKAGLLQLDAQNNVVLASIDSLHIWNGQFFESTELQSSFFYALSDFTINPSNNDMWLSYYTFGAYAIYQYTGQDLNVFNYENSALPFDSPASNPLLIDMQGQIWAGNAYGLYRYDGEEWIDLSSTIPDLPAGEFSALDMDEDGNIWAIVRNFEDSKLIKFTGDDSFDIFDLPNTIETYAQLPFLKVSDVLNPIIYLGTSTDGLWAFDLNEWASVNTSLSDDVSNHTRQIFIDDETTYIIGGRSVNSEPISMSAISEENWIIFDESNLPTSITTDLPEKIVGKYMDTLWVYTGDTLLAYSNGNWSLPQMPDLLPDVDEQNAFIYHEPNGGRWLLEKYQSYLFYQTGQEWLIFEHEEHGAASGIYESYFTHPQTGDFWLASANGISYFDGTNWAIIDPEDYGAFSHWVYDMELDDSGVIWGVTRDVVFKIENYEFSIFAMQFENLPYSSFRSLTFDEQGRLWVGLDHAIAYLEGTEWVIYDNTNSGVPNGAIHELEFDHAGNLWLGSGNGGFAVFNENGLPDYLSQDIHTSIPSEPKEDDSMHVYPNPISKNNTLNVEMNAPNFIPEQTYIMIYDMNGQLLWNEPVRALTTSIPMDIFEAKGAYILKLQTNAQIITSTFIVH